MIGQDVAKRCNCEMIKVVMSYISKISKSRHGGWSLDQTFTTAAASPEARRQDEPGAARGEKGRFVRTERRAARATPERPFCCRSLTRTVKYEISHKHIIHTKYDVNIFSAFQRRRMWFVKREMPGCMLASAGCTNAELS